MCNSIDGVLSRILFHKQSRWEPAGSKYLIGKLTNAQIVKGLIDDPREGESYRFFGEWKDQKGYDNPAFEFTSYEILIDQSTAGVVQYLARYIPGLGPVRSLAIVERLGDETLSILRTAPERAGEVCGVSAATVDAIRAHFEAARDHDPVAEAKLIDLFRGHRVSRSVVTALLRHFRSDAPALVLANPYLLLQYPRMGWKTVDSFALTVAQYDPHGHERHCAAIMEAMNDLASQGHTHASRGEIEAQAFGLIGECPAPTAYAALLRDDDLYRYPETEERASTLALPKLAAAERIIAVRLEVLAAMARPFPCRVDTDGLNEDQCRAVAMIEDNGVCLLVGAPGVGKTTVMAKIIASLVSGGIHPDMIRVCCPTGKAAKRASESLADHLPPDLIACTTIHRALKIGPSAEPIGVPKADAKTGRGREAFGFKHNENDPLKCEYLFIDEFSMVDTSLCASLLRALAPGTRLVIVGDQNQLPSVGPGSCLRDLISAGLPTAELTQIVRSDRAGRVVHACHAIKDGRPPSPAVKAALPTENWVHIEEHDPRRIAQIIVDLHKPSETFPDPLWDMQVVSAQKGKLPFGCDAINRMLAAKLNPAGGHDGDGEEGAGPPFRVGDKIVRTKNGLADQMLEVRGYDFEGTAWEWKGREYQFEETDIVNGDMGQVLDIVPAPRDTYVVVRFRNPDRLCRLSYADSHLIQAYALTIHKMQGSSAPYVIIPVHESFYWDRRSNTGLWCRELFYTAISRTERLAVTVGSFAAIPLAIGRKTINARRTRLASLIQERKPIEVAT